MSSSSSSSLTVDAPVAPVASPTHAQLGFWEQSLADTKGNLLTCMLLHDDEKEAADMDAGETREIFEICDFQKEWVVCEWAAGMGRLTPALARRCSFVYASDFVSSFCSTNTERCREEGVAEKVKVECIDAAMYHPKSGEPAPWGVDQIDMHFVNWLLLYLDDALAAQFVHAAVTSLRKRIHGAPGKLGKEGQSGWVFFHESCWERENESALFAALPAEEQARLLALPCEKTEDCQTYYRKAYWYDELFRKAGLEIVICKELDVYAPSKATSEAEKSEAAQGEDNSDYNRQMVWMLRLKQ